MRVLILPSFYPTLEAPLTGIFYKEQALALQKHGIRSDVIFAEPRSFRTLSAKAFGASHFQIEEKVEDGLVTIRQRGWNPLLATVCGGLIWARLMQRLAEFYIRRFGVPDIIHAHNSLWAGYAAAEITRKHQLPYVITEHSCAFLLGEIPAAASRYVRHAFERAAATLSVSNNLAIAMRDYAEHRRTIVVPNMIDTDFFSLGDLQKPNKPFVFFSAGRLEANKGFPYLLRAFAASFAKHDDVALEIAGAGPQRDELEQLCAALDITHQVSFLGPLTREGIRVRLWRANAFVSASFRETFGIVLIEALATGVPVIATRSGGPEDIVTPEVGMLVDPMDEQQMSNAMRAMWKDTRYHGQLLRNFVLSRYSETVVLKSITEIYQTVIAENRRLQLQ